MSERGVRTGCRPGSASSLLWRRRAAKGEGSSGRSGLTALPLAVSGAGAEWRGFPGLGRGRARAGGPRGPRGRVWAPGDKGARKARGWGPRRKVGEGPNGGSQLCGEGPWTLGAPGPERGQAGRGSGSEGIGEGDGLRGRRDWGLRGRGWACGVRRSERRRPGFEQPWKVGVGGLKERARGFRRRSPGAEGKG